MEALVNWHWPGNIRELENLIERSIILSDGPVLRTPLAELQREQAQPAIADATLESAEREHIIRVLRECGGLVSGAKGAALKLGLKRTTLQSKMGKLKISRKDYASEKILCSDSRLNLFSLRRSMVAEVSAARLPVVVRTDHQANQLVNSPKS
jgi:transcriptional regulator with AAA-type ATPase domain